MPQMIDTTTRAAHELKDYWLARAFESAGIDGSRWQPGRGVEENRRTIEAVYQYYGRLYIAHASLKWAGMASLMGPAFYAGFLDVGALPDAARRLVSELHRAASAGRRLERWLLRREKDADALLEHGLGFFELTFLTMQRKIFEDQATMHEAYLARGLDAIRELYDAGILDRATLDAWEQIDGGEQSGIDQGNRMLLYREQYAIIDHFYARMRTHGGLEGAAFTYLMTVAGTPSIQGARGFSRVFPLGLLLTLPPMARIGPLRRCSALRLRTPLPDGNIAVFSNRWRLIEVDTLPAYTKLVAERPDRLRALVAEPIVKKVRRYRLSKRLGGVALALVTRWKLDLQRDAPIRTVARARAAPGRAPAGRDVTVDLSTPPTRAALEWPDTTDHRSWTAGTQGTFRASVLLPQARVYRADAQLVVLLSPRPGGNPTRLTVRGPPVGVERARAILEAATREWRIDAGDPAAVPDPAAVAGGRGDLYGTRLLRPERVGFVEVEIQVEHHVMEREFVITALFSWNDPGLPATDG